ncbi:hypothetical protein LJC58_10455 [Lachnospiraceae bacterium OttesenSCG-928-D06]|nr:hypothetical protein [Lachnospiraceae bacterium OttesenSCG-928-D06]
MTNGVSIAIKNGRSDYTFINATGEIGIKIDSEHAYAQLDYVNKALEIVYGITG